MIFVLSLKLNVNQLVDFRGEPNYVDSMSTKELILKYWQSWQQPADFDEMERCLADEVTLDFAGMPMEGAKAVRQMVEASPDPWTDVKLIDAVYTTDGGALIYEGTSSKSGARVRVAEVLHVEGDRIVRGSTVIAPMA